jgi:8-oxo-dGTP pyrophosphatase MutT (NUDIX family)
MVQDKASVRRVARCRIELAAYRWDLVEERRAEIDAFWRRQSAANASYFDGVVHLLSAHRIDGDLLAATAFATRFRNYLYWRETGYADTSVIDAFGSAVIRCTDGGVLLARQRSGNINSGLVYLPGGFIDERDVGADGCIDIGASIAREIAEETGLDCATMTAEPGFTVTRVGQHLSIAATYHSGLDGAELRRRVGAHIAGDARGELETVLIAGNRRDLAGLPLVHYCRALLPALLD